MMNEWQPIETAPKTGVMLFTNYNGCPVFISWLRMDGPTKTTITGRWPFKKKTSIREKEEGWRILMLDRSLSYCVHGNYGPITPTHWMPIFSAPIAEDQT